MNKTKPRGGDAKAFQKRKGKAKARPVDPAVRKVIGNRLRAYYNTVAQEPVPDRFVELLEQLDAQGPVKA